MPITPRLPEVVRTSLTALVLVFAMASSARAQEPGDTPEPSEPVLATAGKVLAGGALALALHEGGHLTFDLMLGTSPGIKRVSYAGIPFFAITHDSVSPPKEFTISSAGFWAQHVSSEWILVTHPTLRKERAPVLKGMLAFNVLASLMYTGVALGRTGPPERDTRGIAASAGMAEPWVAPVIATPAVLDTIRYFRPESRVVRWASRAAKVGGVLLVLKARS